jgi:hypothetical protein
MDTKGNLPDIRVLANRIEIPQFGTAFLAELELISDVLDLTMIRFQGESPALGSIEIAVAMCSAHLITTIK